MMTMNELYCFFQKDIKSLPGIGEKRATAFRKIGVITFSDLLFYRPYRYDDYTSFKPLSAFALGETATVKVRILEPAVKVPKKALDIYNIIAFDGERKIKLVFFNAKYTVRKLIPGKEFIVIGKNTDEWSITAPKVTSADSAALVPRYFASPTIKGIIGKLIVRLLTFTDSFPEILPQQIVEKYNLMPFGDALWGLHFPKTVAEAEMAKRRLDFDKIFAYQIMISYIKHRSDKRNTFTLDKTKFSIKEEFMPLLDYKLTSAQKRAVIDVMSDMTGNHPMNRLIQGDVGSGKTVVAACGVYAAVKNGFQAAFMVPTSVLAYQHYTKLTPLFSRLGVHTELLVGKTTAAEKRRIYLLLESGEPVCVFGTHALISEKVNYGALALVVTDEQHRFGVNQRGMLTGKSACPHVLVMSATPIPRTMNIVLYGDLDISVIDTLPPGRVPVTTHRVKSTQLQKVYSLIVSEATNARQAYIVCPLVEDAETNSESEEDSILVSAETMYKNLSESEFSGITTGLIHGKMNAKEKDRVLSNFTSGKIKVLFSTTVVEVGVDVPSATVMLIMNSERFGIAQLHQLRGRIGRGHFKGYCFLQSDSRSESAERRIKALCETTDGFVLAQKDFDERGAGDLFGTEQHGINTSNNYSIINGIKMYNGIKELCEEILQNDSELRAPENLGIRMLEKLYFQSRDKYVSN